jgi:hypothetical protein
MAPLVMNLFNYHTNAKIVEKVQNEFNVSIWEYPNSENRNKDPNFLNLLSYYHRFKTERYGPGQDFVKYTKILAEKYLKEETYPSKKSIIESFPWNMEHNQKWCANNLENDVWIKKYTKEYQLTKEDLNQTNYEERIEHHISEVNRYFEKLGENYILKPLTLENLPDVEKEVNRFVSNAEKTKMPSDHLNWFKDVQTQIKSIRTLFGQKQSSSKYNSKIKICMEFNPMEILNMGNCVNGSCLATYGINYWSSMVNAYEINKKVLWAKNSKGEIIARLLIAVDKDKFIVRFPIYYNTDIDLNKFFNKYLVSLAKDCNFSLNGNIDNIENLLFKQWYKDPVEKIKEVD